MSSVVRRSTRLSTLKSDLKINNSGLEKSYISLSDTELSENEDSGNERQNGDFLPISTMKSLKEKTTPRKNKTVHSENFVEPSTPPKIKKFNSDEYASDILKTPSSMLKQLALKSPENNSKTEKRGRKSLFNDAYQLARKALHSSVPTSMPGRQKELDELRTFINEHVKNKTSASLYISGLPGTGKTASLSLILEENEIKRDVQIVYINCTSIKSAGAVYSNIIKEIGLKSSGKSEKDNLSTIEKHFTKCNKMMLLVLDEMDQLQSKNQSVLYTIFEWPARITSKIILIGIANALDLTDRILPRLQARCELKPKLLHFSPYSKQQILEIISDRLKSVDCMKVFSPAGLQMLCGKVAAISGDVRRALDIARRVVEIIERDDQEVLKPIENMNNLENIKMVELKEVISVLNNVYGTGQNLSDDCDSAFPLQQKIIICSLLLILNKAKNKDVTIGRLHDVYKRVCAKRFLYAVDQAEFVGLCSLIETKGILRVIGKKEPRLHKILLQWDEEEVFNALKDKTLISSILEDEGCLGK